ERARGGGVETGDATERGIADLVLVTHDRCPGAGAAGRDAAVDRAGVAVVAVLGDRVGEIDAGAVALADVAYGAGVAVVGVGAVAGLAEPWLTHAITTELEGAHRRAAIAALGVAVIALF